MYNHSMIHLAGADERKEMDRIRQLIDAAVGPAPWYWETFPTLHWAGKTFKWRSFGTTGKLAYVTVLEEEGVGKPLLALNTAARPFAANPGYIGVWHSTWRGKPIEVHLFKVDELRPLKRFRGRALEFKKTLEQSLLCDITPIERAEIEQELPEGTHSGPTLRYADQLEELFLVASPPPDEGLVHSIYVWDPRTGSISVLPQRWFKEDDIDPGYQWITRAARDPQTGHIIGGGIRIPRFELDDTGMYLKRRL